MKSVNQISKKELSKLIKSKISIGISEIVSKGEKTGNVQKAIKEASKLISSELRKNLKAGKKTEFITQPVSEPSQPEVKNVAKKAVKRSPTIKKASKNAKGIKKVAGKVKVAKKAVKKAAGSNNVIDTDSVQISTV